MEHTVTVDGTRRSSTDRGTAYISKSYLYVFIFPRFSSSFTKTQQIPKGLWFIQIPKESLWSWNMEASSKREAMQTCGLVGIPRKRV